MRQAMVSGVHFGKLRMNGVGVAAMCLISAATLTAQQYGDGQYGGNQYQDPPSRVARVAYAQGNVSLEPSGVDTWSAAELNYPLTAGDRIYVDNRSLGELQTGGLAVRLSNGADLTLTSLTDSVAQFGLAQGSVRLRTRELWAPDGQQAVVEVDTPNGTVLVQQAGDMRVDSYPQDDTTVVTVNSGAAEVSGQGFDQTIGPNQSLRLTGSNPVYAEQVELLPQDDLDRFDNQRERRRGQSASLRNQYVDPDMIGVADLDDYGDWQPSGDYGPVWYPRNVGYGWTPYSVGHWAWVAPWGWTWVDSEPWGFAPFHYGRWNNFGGRWGWVPGPPPSVFRDGGFGGRPPRPVYSPALVAFVGGPSFSLSIGFGGGGGVAAWFPLGPREVYKPWYNSSPAYNNRVNVTNIYNTNVTEIHNTYINKTTNIYNNTTTNVVYVNRNTATVAVAQKDFAAGHSVAQSQPIKLDDHLRQQLAQAPILPHPLVTPARGMAAPTAPAQAVPPIAARPVVETRQGFQRAGAPPSATPLKAPVAITPAQAARTGGGFPQAPAAVTNAAPINRAGLPQPRPVQTIQPVTPAAAPARPNQPLAPGGSAPASYGVRNPNPPAIAPQVAPRPAPAALAPVAPQPLAPVKTLQAPTLSAPAKTYPVTVPLASVPARPAPRPLEQVRPLQTITPPQPVQPSFEQQRKAIQQVDPGRPLVPQQMNNLRVGKPAGLAPEPESAHPALPAKPKSAPAEVKDGKK